MTTITDQKHRKQKQDTDVYPLTMIIAIVAIGDTGAGWGHLMSRFRGLDSPHENCAIRSRLHGIKSIIDRDYIETV